MEVGQAEQQFTAAAHQYFERKKNIYITIVLHHEFPYRNVLHSMKYEKCLPMPINLTKTMGFGPPCECYVTVASGMSITTFYM